MLHPFTLKFLGSLQKNNNKAWFETHRESYDEAKADFLSLVEKLIPALANIDRTIAGQLAKHCTFRINRDVRFSKNKTPYKNNMAAYFNKAGKKGNGAGYYLHIEPGKSFAAAGIWQPAPEDLSKIRQEVDYNYNNWKKIVSTASFKKNFNQGIDITDTLARPPKGYAEENPAIAFLKLKSFVIRHALTDEEILHEKFVKNIIHVFKAALPVVNFLNTAID